MRKLIDALFGQSEENMAGIPTGKILWVVSLRGVNGVWLLPEIKDTILNDGYNGVALKILHGFRYNNAFEDIQEFFDKLRGKVQIYGWQWNLLEDANEAEKEAIWARKAFDAFKLDGFMANPEAHAKDRPDMMRVYAGELKERFPNYPIGYTSYRFPSAHPEYPWDTVASFDYHAPQVYWVNRHNPAQQLERSVNELIAEKDMPIVPLGSVYRNEDYNWEPTPDELREFDQKAKDMGLQGVQWFAWRSAKPLGLLPTLAELNWDIEPPVVEPKYTQAELDQAVSEARSEEQLLCEQRIDTLKADHAEHIEQVKIEAHNNALRSLIDPFLR